MKEPWCVLFLCGRLDMFSCYVSVHVNLHHCVCYSGLIAGAFSVSFTLGQIVWRFFHTRLLRLDLAAFSPKSVCKTQKEFSHSKQRLLLKNPAVQMSAVHGKDLRVTVKFIYSELQVSNLYVISLQGGGGGGAFFGLHIYINIYNL